MRILPRKFYTRDPVIVAPDLLGKMIVRVYHNHILSGIIVETEAYRNDDPASHSYQGKTKRNEVMFGNPGKAYVYFIYGNHFCLNFVSRTLSICAGGVLIRAIEPCQEIDIMQTLRGTQNIKNLTNGPGKLTQALGITKELNGIDVTKKGALYVVEKKHEEPFEIRATQRIGIRHAVHQPWRFYIKNNPYVSRV